jgi:hypothetical protein
VNGEATQGGAKIPNDVLLVLCLKSIGDGFEAQFS